MEKLEVRVNPETGKREVRPAGTNYFWQEVDEKDKNLVAEIEKQSEAKK